MENRHPRCSSGSCRRFLVSGDKHKECRSCNPDRAECDGVKTCDECSTWTSKQLEAFRISKATVAKKSKRKSNPREVKDQGTPKLKTTVPIKDLQKKAPKQKTTEPVKELQKKVIAL